MATANNGINPAQYPYLYQMDKLKFSYPCLGVLAHRLLNTIEEGRQIVDHVCRDENGIYHPPGRCCVLEFRTSTTKPSVTPVRFKDVAGLRTYLEQYSPINGKPISSDCNHRLYILEDLAPEYVEPLGHHLHVDPLVFASQINSWRFLNTGTVAQRTLPSLNNPKESFTVRYPELRSFDRVLDDWRWTFASNRRKIDPWFPIPGGRVEMNDQVALVRRCASFWVDNAEHNADGWNALLLVDPPVDAYKDPKVPQPKGPTVTYRVIKKRTDSDSKNPHYEPSLHSSRPFHFGHPDPIPIRQAIKFTAAGSRTGKPIYRKKQSLFDEAILYWTHNDNSATIKSAIAHPSNTTTYVLKIIAYNWTSLLELVLLTLNQGEFVTDEERRPARYGAPTPQNAPIFMSSHQSWKKEISQLYTAIFYLNILRRRLAFFEDDLIQALEHLHPNNLTSSSPSTSPLEPPSALLSATLDFSALLHRLKLYKSRAETLASTTDEIMNLRSAAKSLDDSAFNLRLAVFAAIVFPATFVAAMFGMSDGFKPGDGRFWVFWVVSVPLILGMVAVILGRGFKGLAGCFGPR